MSDASMPEAMDPAERRARRHARLWAVAFLGGMFGMAFFLTRTGLIASPWGMMLMLAPMALLVPLIRASERLQSTRGYASSVTMRYNRRMMWASLAYMIGLFAAIFLFRDQQPGPVAATALALLPTLPIFAMLWAMGRYIIEETDEYLRGRTINAALVATGLLLAVATFWGFLTTFGVAPAVPMWAAVPIWCLGLGVGNLVNRMRGA